MVRPKAGDVVIVPFPYSDLSQSKVRPALCLVEASADDWILCQITSQRYTDPAAIMIEASDFGIGRLNLTSYVRPAKLFTANQTLIHGVVGTLKPATTAAILQRVAALFVKT